MVDSKRVKEMGSLKDTKPYPGFSLFPGDFVNIHVIDGVEYARRVQPGEEWGGWIHYAAHMIAHKDNPPVITIESLHGQSKDNDGKEAEGSKA